MKSQLEQQIMNKNSVHKPKTQDHDSSPVDPSH